MTTANVSFTTNSRRHPRVPVFDMRTQRSSSLPGRIIPILTWSVDYELHGNELWLQAEPEWPQLNPDYLRRFTGSLEEQSSLLDELGLLDTTDSPPVSFVRDILDRMEELNILEDCSVQLDPNNLESLSGRLRANASGVNNGAGLFVTEASTYTAGLIRDLNWMIRTDLRGWENTALGTLLGVSKPRSKDPRSTVEVVPLNHEQREAVRESSTSPLTVVTGPPGTGKSQIIVSMIADSYARGRRVLFTSKNNKAVDVVEKRVSELANDPLLIRTGSTSHSRDFRQELLHRLTAMMSLRPSEYDRQEYDLTRLRNRELREQENDLWTELEAIRSLHERVIALDKVQANFEPEITPDVWERIQELERVPNTRHLRQALQLAIKHLEDDTGIFRRFALWRARASDLRRIHGIAKIAAGICPAVGSCPEVTQSFQAWHAWLRRAISIADALEAIIKYRGGLAELRELRSRDEVARQLRRVRGELTDTGAKLTSLYAKLAPDRLDQTDRQALDSFSALHDRLANDQLGGPEYKKLRRDWARLFPQVSQHIPAWCVTNLSVQRNFELEPGLFDLLIIDEASQCDIASALPLLYRSKRAAIIGDSQQLRHVAKIERRRDQQLQASYGLSSAEDLRFAYSTRSLFELSAGVADKQVQLRDHYRSHHRITDFSNRHWYQNSLRVWTNYKQLKTPPRRENGHPLDPSEWTGDQASQWQSLRASRN